MNKKDGARGWPTSEAGQFGIQELIPIIGLILMVLGILLLAGGTTGNGLVVLGIGLLILGIGGQATYSSELGTVSGGAGLILIVVGIVYGYLFG